MNDNDDHLSIHLDPIFFSFFSFLFFGSNFPSLILIKLNLFNSDQVIYTVHVQYLGK